MTRFDRQKPIIGEEGQDRICSAHVAVAGCGGLGCNVITQLISAGVRHITIIDHDVITESDLNRQFVYAGKSGRKVSAMKDWILSLAPDADVTAIDGRLTDENSDDFLKDVDIAVDCLDDNSSRFILNDAVLRRNIPLVHGAIDSMYGQVTVVILGKTPCLGCILRKKDAGLIPSVPSAVSFIASVQINEVLKIVTGKGRTLAGKLFTADLENMVFDTIDIKKDPNCEHCR